MWPQPSAAQIAIILADRGISDDSILRQCLGLYARELETLLDSGADIAAYKKQKLQTRGILHVPEPHCDAVGLENVTNLLEDVKQLLSPEAEAVGLPFPKGMILLGVPGVGEVPHGQGCCSDNGRSPHLCQLGWVAVSHPW